MARLYDLVKGADPYHVVSGAIQCETLWMWSDVSSYLPPSAIQPVLQLSLDYPMHENYGDGVLATAGNSHAAALRNGAEFEPIANCVGLWDDATFKDHPASPQITRSELWLGVIASGMPNQLVFILQETGFASSVGQPDGGWLQTIQPAIWGAEIRALMPSVLAPYGTVPTPSVAVLSATPLVASAAGPPHLDGPLVRAGAWAEPCATVCAHLVVVNLHQQSFVHFSLRITDLATSDSPVNATRLFDSSYNVTIEADGTMSDYIGPGDSSVYEIGCSGPKPSSDNTLECANRRVVCKKGFVTTDPNNATCSYW